MTKTIILLSGKQRSGKDTIADILSQSNFKRVAFADSLKQEVSDAYGISLAELESLKNSTAEYRGLLIAWAKCRTLKEPDYFVKKALKNSIELSKIVITDFRFQKEVDIVHATFPEANIVTIRVECNEEIRSQRGTLSNSTDASEVALDDYDFDHTIFNNGTLAELKKQAEELQGIL